MLRLVMLLAPLSLAAPVTGPAVAPAQVTVTLLGTGNPRPSAERFGPSILIEAGSERILLDVGRGAASRLFEIGSAPMLTRITAVLLTHLHSDHTVGLPDLWLTGWIFGRTAPLTVYGPAGTRDMAAHLEQAYSVDVHTRRDLDERLPAGGAELEARDIEPGLVFERGGVRVTAFAVDHRPLAPAFGYRIEYAGRVVVFSGDTRPTAAIIEQATSVDLLVHEVISPELERRESRIGNAAAVERIIAHHTTPEEAGRIFAAAHPRLAVYSHIVPSPAKASDLVGPTRRFYRGPLVVGYDLMRIDVGDRIVTSRRRRVAE